MKKKGSFTPMESNEANNLRIEKIMHRPVITCRPMDSLHTAAALMWDHDCGALPVVDEDGRVLAMITDRDICMAAFTQGLPLVAMKVKSAMSNQLHACHPEDPVTEAEKRMGEKQVRRLPVVDLEGRVQGILTLNDLARETSPSDRAASRQGGPPQDVLRTLRHVGEPHREKTHFA